jgi:hypothetical protein
MCFRCPVLSYSSKEACAYSYALIIRQNHETANSPILLLEWRMQKRYEAHGLTNVDSYKVFCCLIKLGVQIVIVPKEPP